MKKLALCSVLALLSITCSKKSDLGAPLDNLTVSGSGRWKLKEFRESFGVPVSSWVRPLTDTFYVEFGANNVFKSNTSFFASRTQYQFVNDSTLILSAPGYSDLPVKKSFAAGCLQLDGPCFEPCSYRFTK